MYSPIIVLFNIFIMKPSDYFLYSDNFTGIPIIFPFFLQTFREVASHYQTHEKYTQTNYIYY